MAPLTRMRAAKPSLAPRPLNVEYYAQRTTPGGLIIAEASPVVATGFDTQITNAVTPALSVGLRRQPNIVERVRPGVRIHEAADPLVERFGLERMEHVTARDVVIQDFFDLLVDLRRGGGIGGRACLEQELKATAG